MAILALLLLLAGSAAAAEPAPLKPLWVRPVRTPTEGARFDPSGLASRYGTLLTVSDKPEFPSVYALRPDGDGYRAEEYLALRGPSPGSDHEGLAVCDGFMLIVEESSGSLLVVANDAGITVRNPELAKLHARLLTAPAFGTKGAGLEGVACAPDGRVWIANERQYRMIYALDRESWAATEAFDLPAGLDSPRRAGAHEVWPDYADLHFADGFLYALQRNDRVVLKIDPITRALAARARLELDEAALYEYRDPFGMAEGLLVEKERILVLLDNNGAPRKGKPDDRSALLIAYPRPPGF